MAIAEERARHFSLVFPDSSVIVETHGEMIRDQIFTGCSQIHGIPVLKFISHFSKSSLRYGAVLWVLLFKENIVEDFMSHVFRFDVHRIAFLSV